ncbi:hypothetical protein O1M54_00200 [Streptomyces diastatochromogenes]|nr:hypothetical protein [Streptomyces diastatochromogenes]
MDAVHAEGAGAWTDLVAQEVLARCDEGSPARDLLALLDAALECAGLLDAEAVVPWHGPLADRMFTPLALHRDELAGRPEVAGTVSQVQALAEASAPDAELILVGGVGGVALPARRPGEARAGVAKLGPSGRSGRGCGLLAGVPRPIADGGTRHRTGVRRSFSRPAPATARRTGPRGHPALGRWSASPESRDHSLPRARIRTAHRPGGPASHGRSPPSRKATDPPRW